MTISGIQLHGKSRRTPDGLGGSGSEPQARLLLCVMSIITSSPFAASAGWAAVVILSHASISLSGSGVGTGDRTTYNTCSLIHKKEQPEPNSLEVQLPVCDHLWIICALQYWTMDKFKNEHWATKEKDKSRKCEKHKCPFLVCYKLQFHFRCSIRKQLASPLRSSAGLWLLLIATLVMILTAYYGLMLSNFWEANWLCELCEEIPEEILF